LEAQAVKEIVHSRDIVIRTFDLGEGRVLVEGRLRDQRHRPRPGETTQGPLLVHDMVARFKVRGPDMVIEEVEAEMPQHPRDECDEVLPQMRKLAGERIVSGFTQRVKDLVGNSKGCAHLTSLFITMGPAAVQGFWAAYGVDRSRIRHDDPRIQKVINTCHLWREDGPIMRVLREMQEQGR
jgi:hypothetical protein